MSVRVSIIATVKNEEATIGRLLDSLAAQTRAPDEVVLADGGSTDRTREIADSYTGRGLPLRVVDAPGSNISQGRNQSIRAATCEVIASVDAGVRLEPSWLAELAAPWDSAPDGAPDVVSGFFQADAATLFETAMGATVLPDLADVDPSTFLPSSRSVAFTRRAWEAAGGYPEWLDYCEDLVFDLRLREAGCRFEFRPQALVHFRPRPTLKAFFVQYFRYARGDGKADLWRKRHLARYAAYLVGAPALFALAALQSPWWVMVGLAGAAAYCRRPWQRLWPRLSGYGWVKRLAGLAAVPVIRLVGDVAKMLGYPVGLWWRWRHRHDPVVHWRAVPKPGGPE